MIAGKTVVQKVARRVRAWIETEWRFIAYCCSKVARRVRAWIETRESNNGMFIVTCF